MRPDRGFAIVSAIFIVVALSALGAGMMYFSSLQHVTGMQDVLGSRALAAARAGSESMVAKIMDAEVDNNPRYACPVVPNFIFDDFTLSVSCTHSTHDDEGNRIRVYEITSIARTGGSTGSMGYVERQVATVAATCRRTDDGLLC